MPRRASGRFALAILASVALGPACSSNKERDEPLAVRVGHHDLTLVTPRGWERLDHGRQQLFRNGETELLLSEPRSAEDYQHTLQVIEAELKKLSRIVEGLFTLAMADAGQLRLASEPIYLNEVLEESCDLARPLAQAREIAIERQLDQDAPGMGDETFLRQLFLIFLDNAIKYSPPGTRVRVSLEASDGLAQVRFEDQGEGISPDHLPHIFERFYRAGRADGGESRSGGLGLAIAQAIVRAQDGSIACQSECNHGSTFTVLLPFQHPPESS